VQEGFLHNIFFFFFFFKKVLLKKRKAPLSTQEIYTETAKAAHKKKKEHNKPSNPNLEKHSQLPHVSLAFPMPSGCTCITVVDGAYHTHFSTTYSMDIVT
jgi:hypothetical protein